LKPTWRLGAAALVVACWLSAGAAPFVDAVHGLRQPADFVRDYVAARTRLEEGRGPPPKGEAANQRALAYGAPAVGLYGAPYFIHPPTATTAVLPLACLPWRAAALAWAGLSLIALAWLARSLVGIWRRDRPPSAVPVALLTLALALWPPTLHCFEKGQWSIWLAALLAAGLRAFEAGRPRRAGVAFGIAAALKVTPIVLLGFLLLRRRRAAVALLATGALAALVALSAVGPGAWMVFLAESPHNAAVWAPWIANTASLDGVYARLLTSNPFSRALFVAPRFAAAAFGLTELALLAAALGGALSSRRHRTMTQVSERRLLAAWLTLPVLLNPLGWSHVVLMLLAPLAVSARDGGPRRQTTAMVLLAILSIPRQRLAAWAGGLPVGPAAGVLLGLHAFTGVALFATLRWPHPTPAAEVVAV
jgi:alpha-1,2-mannosyltransferase